MRFLLALVVCLAGAVAICAPAAFTRPIKLPHVLKGHTDEVICIAFNRDSTTLASGSLDKTIRLWDVKTGKQTLVIHNVHPSWNGSVAFSPDGKTLVLRGSDNKTIVLRSLKTGKTTLTLKGSSAVCSFAWKGKCCTQRAHQVGLFGRLQSRRQDAGVSKLGQHDHPVGREGR